MKTKLYKILFLAIISCFVISTAQAKDYIYVPVSNALHIIDCDTDAIVKTVDYNDYILGAAISPDKKRYYLNAVHSIYAIDTEKNELIDTYRLSSELSKVDILGFTVSADSKKLYLSCSIAKKKQNIPRLNVFPPQLAVYDIAKKKVTKNYQIPYGVMSCIALKDNKSVILGGLDFYKLDLESQKIEKFFGLLNPEKDKEVKNALAIWNSLSPGDHGIFNVPYYTATGMTYLLIDTKDGAISEVKGKDVFFEYSAVISYDKRFLYAVMDELIKVDLKTGETVKRIPLERGTNYAVNITSDGKKVYVGPAGNDLSVYDSETLKLIGIINLEADGVVAHRLTL